MGHFLFPRRVQMCRFFEEQRVDAAGKRAVTLQKFIMFFTTIDIVVSIFGFPSSMLVLAIRLTVAYVGWFGATRRNHGCLMTFAILRIIQLVLDTFGIILSIFFIAALFGFVAYETSTGEISVDPTAATISVAVGTFIFPLILAVTIIMLGLQLYVIILAFQTASLVRSAQNAPDAEQALAGEIPTAVPMKQLDGQQYYGVPTQVPEFHSDFVKPQAPIYLQQVQM